MRFTNLIGDPVMPLKKKGIKIKIYRAHPLLYLKFGRTVDSISCCLSRSERSSIHYENKMENSLLAIFDKIPCTIYIYIYI